MSPLMNRRQTQREEVRQVLHAIRLELAAQRLVQNQLLVKSPILRLDDVIKRAQTAHLSQ